MHLYVSVDGGTTHEGPFTLEEIKERIRYGSLSPTLLMIWFEGQKSWVPLTDVFNIDIPSPASAALRSPISPKADNSQVKGKLSFKAIFSLIFSLLALLSFLIGLGIFGWLFVIAALTFSGLAKKDFQKNKPLRGRSLLKATRIMFWLFIGFVVFAIFAAFAFPILESLRRPIKEQPRNKGTGNVSAAPLSTDNRALHQQQNLGVSNSDETKNKQLDTKAIYEMVSPRIVKIETLNELGQAAEFGSGVALGPSLSEVANRGMHPLIYLDHGTDIVTNFHVIKNAEFIFVNTKDGLRYAANIVFFDRDCDLAIIRIPALIAAAEIGIADSPDVADKVIAIGYPQGRDLTISEGIVSAAPKRESGILQTTAAISQGSSGGGLFDSSGNLIGITFASLEDSQNMNFAVWLRAELVKSIAESRKGNAINTGALWKSDKLVGYYQWDSNYLLNPQWEATYRKDTAFADYINLVTRIEAQQTQRHQKMLSIFKDKLLTDRDKEKEWNKLRQEADRSLAPLIKHRYELYPDDLSGCLDYLNTINDDVSRAALLEEWTTRWPTKGDEILFAGVDSRERPETVVKIVSAFRDTLLQPASSQYDIADEWSRNRFNAFKVEAESTRRSLRGSFNSILTDTTVFKEFQRRGIDFSRFLLKDE